MTDSRITIVLEGGCVIAVLGLPGQAVTVIDYDVPDDADVDLAAIPQSDGTTCEAQGYSLRTEQNDAIETAAFNAFFRE